MKQKTKTANLSELLAWLQENKDPLDRIEAMEKELNYARFMLENIERGADRMDCGTIAHSRGKIKMQANDAIVRINALIGTANKIPLY